MAKLLSSSIGKKLLMSISGLFLILFLTFHMSMNLVAIFSGDAYNAVCAFLGANWYALVATKILAIGFLVHIVYAFILTAQNQKARSNIKYIRVKTPKGVSFASQNMLILGVIVIAGMGIHLAQFWYKMQFAEIVGHHEVELGGGMVSVADGAAFLKYWFSQPLVVGIYLVWLTALWLHLTHAFWSAIQSIGWNNLVWINRLKVISDVIATIICAGFAAVVVAYYVMA